MKNKLLVVVIFFTAIVCAAALPVKTFNFEEGFPKTLRLDSYKNPNSLNPVAKAKWYENNREWKKCLETIEKVSHTTQVSLWVSVTHLNCMKNTYETTSSVRVQKLINSFSGIEKNKSALIQSPFVGHKALLIKVYLTLMKKSLDQGRDVFDDFVNRNHDIVDQFNDEQRAKYYQYMGEIAWLRQKNELATNNFLRSYLFEENREVLGRLKALDSVKYLKLDKYKDDAGANVEEKRDWKDFIEASDKGQTIKVVQKGVRFLDDYPGSENTDEVSRRIAVFFKRLLYRREQKYVSQKEAFMSNMTKAPSQFISEWADIAYQRGYYNESLMLADVAVDKWKGRVEAAQPLLVAARSAYYQTKWSECEKYLKRLIEKHSGHENHFEAQYLLGLLYYRRGSFEKVVSVFDKFLLNEGSDKWELQSRYWLWRAMLKIKSPRADELAETILKEFPLTYYGLVVRMETKGSLQSLIQKEIPKISTEYWWTLHTDKRWSRIKKLLEYGWVEEAEREIDMLPDPQLAPAYIVRAKLWGSAYQTRRAMRDFSQAVDKDTSFITKSLLLLSFPKEFQSEVSAATKEFSISEELIWAIMRQESAFDPRAMSPSAAYGLMQLLKPTMNETAQWLKAKNFNLSRDVYDPKKNVRFGTHFLSRMIRKYKGVIPLAVASYNVGPGNLDRWLSHRDDLEGWREYGNDRDEDMWMDELPWGETSFYVKAVMRNYLLYRIIHGEYDKLETPSWSGAQDFYQVPESS